MSGVLVVDKPLGPTSHDVVARVRRAVRERKIGHTGTLDPLATGVLPLVVGRATRLASLLSGSTKEYVASVRFGAATATYDAESLEAPPPEPPGLSAAVIEPALARFRGTHLQTPPPYSAKKIEGVAAYKRARSNEPVTPRPVQVSVHDIVLEEYTDGLARIRLSTSAGFYVRSFAHDLGQALGCGAHLAGLQRTRAGDFTLADAVPLERIEQEPGIARSALIPLERLVPELPGVVLTAHGARRASHGNALTRADIMRPADDGAGGSASGSERRPIDTSPAVPRAGEREAGSGGDAVRVRLLDGEGALLAIAEARENGLLHPVIVLV